MAHRSARRSTLLSAGRGTYSGVGHDSERDPDAGLDEHEEFLRSMGDFRKLLLKQFIAQGSAPPSQVNDGPGRQFSKRSNSFSSQSNGEAVRQPPAMYRSGRSALSFGEEPYLGRFERPFPAHPIEEALLPEGRPGGRSMPFIDAGTPRVCIVMRGEHRLRDMARQALCRLAADPVGLVVTVKPITLASEDRKREELLLFVGVGLGPSLKPDGTPSLDERVSRTADERRIIWTAVHEALGIAPEGERLHAQDAQEELREVVTEVFMLQEAWLYERLLRWLRQQRKKTWCGCFQALFWQEELDLLVHEFGEEIATHFLFVQSYTWHLGVAGVVGFGCWFTSHVFQGTFFGWTGKFSDLPPIARIPWVVLVLFMPAWGFHFLATWKAVASHAGFRWNGSLSSVQNSVYEVARLESLESASQKRRRYLRVASMCAPLMVVQLLVVLAITAAFICIEVYIYDVLWETVHVSMRFLACVVYNLSFGIAFMLILIVFYPISKKVTEWEGHPDPLLVRYHRIAKLFANWFFAIFFYFFIIAFLYIPFGADMSRFFAQFAPESPEDVPTGTEGTETVRAALQEFRPDIHRLFVDVTLFFVLQDGLRILHVLYPSIRAWWSLGCSREDSRPRGHKRTAIISGVRGLCEAATGQADGAPAGGIGRLSLLTEDAEPFDDDIESMVAYCLLGGIAVDGAGAQQEEPQPQTLRLTCSLARAGAPADDAWAPGGQGVHSRLRYFGGADAEIENSGDLFTLVCDPTSAERQGLVRLRVSAAILQQGEEEVGSREVELPLAPEECRQGWLELGPVKVRYTAGIARAASHCAALDCVLSQLDTHLPEIQKHGSSPPCWMWWDEQLAAIHWDGVLELFAVHDTFETFELYGHLTTQFAYACLFTVVVPFIPGLAMLFTSLEARQDQLRILWLCRPPHPQPDEGTITLGAWYDILCYVCHLSVLVNLLLWGLTYEGIGGDRSPSEWDSWEWWRNLAALMLLEKGYNVVTWLLGNYVSMLDTGTAAQFLRREEKFKRMGCERNGMARNVSGEGRAPAGH